MIQMATHTGLLEEIGGKVITQMFIVVEYAILYNFLRCIFCRFTLLLGPFFPMHPNSFAAIPQV